MRDEGTNIAAIHRTDESKRRASPVDPLNREVPVFIQEIREHSASPKLGTTETE